MVDIDWLDGDEQRVYRVFSRMSRDLFNCFDCDLEREVGIPRSYYEILFVLGPEADRGLRLGELAAATRTRPSRITHAVGRLVAAGLVTRDAAPDDGRSAVVTLTEAGADTLRRAARRHAESVRTYLLDALSPGQRDSLRRISERVLARIEATR